MRTDSVLQRNSLLRSLAKFAEEVNAVILLMLLSSLVALGQNTSLSGIVSDSSESVVPGAWVVMVNVSTNVTRRTTTNASGSYYFNALPAGRYDLTVSVTGFGKEEIRSIVVAVASALSQDVKLKVSTATTSTTVTTAGVDVDTSGATVGTVVDHQFVENIPLNGRSFQSLLTLVPGVAVVSSQGSGLSGEMTVNGQRTESNYYQVDGVSANTGANPATPGTGAGFGGSTPGSSVIGMTQSLISVDALQEFRALTSTYSARFGRTPGGQFSFSSRSGTNTYHGSLYNYFRNDKLDANNWFSNATSTAKPAERQNDFGGTVGGPVRIPGLYNGRDRFFFFASYEGFRLRIPQPGIQTDVPTERLRQIASPALRPFLNAFPRPGPNAVDRGNGLATIALGYSYPSDSDTASLRLDYSLTDRHKIFGRYSYAPSYSETRSTYSLSNAIQANGRVQTATVGLSSVLSPRLSNELTLNETENRQRRANALDSFGGATPFSLDSYPGYAAGEPGWMNFYINFGRLPYVSISPTSNLQRQWNLVDALSYVVGRHVIQIGADYRRLATQQAYPSLYQFAQFSNQNQLIANTPQTSTVQRYAGSVYPIYNQLGLYVQDEWRATKQMTISAGLRWDLVGPPSDGDGNLPRTLINTDNPSLAALAPPGTQLFATRYRNFAPRLGVAYQFRPDSAYSTVLRVGGGLFYDTGSTQATRGYYGVGRISGGSFNGSPFPLTQQQIDSVRPGNTAVPYAFGAFPYDPQFRTPRTMQWNFAIEQSLGSMQTLTVNYLGSAGRQLPMQRSYLPSRIANPNFQTYGFYLTSNGSSSSYQALQTRYQQRLSHGLQVLASHTWSHSIDDASSNFQINKRLRADSDFDIRQNFQLALVYRTPVRGKSLAARLLNDWGIDTRFSGRSSQPLDIIGGFNYDPVTSTYINFQPNFNVSVPPYLSDRNAPGGRRINYAAFTAAPTGVQGNLGRNFARGFNAMQLDLGFQRVFRFGERFTVQPRIEAFNVTNRANFGDIYNRLVTDGPSLFGLAYQTQNTSLGGLNSLYQTGGPRSLQLSLRLAF